MTGTRGPRCFPSGVAEGAVEDFTGMGRVEPVCAWTGEEKKIPGRGGQVGFLMTLFQMECALEWREEGVLRSINELVSVWLVVTENIEEKIKSSC